VVLGVLLGRNALFAACVVAVCYGSTRSARGALAAGAAVACLGAAHPAAFSSDRMPHVYAAVAVISALFAAPMALELALHGNGNFARYFAYRSSSSAGGHRAPQVTGFVLWFWWPGSWSS
jgi:hypothetical protein